MSRRPDPERIRQAHRAGTINRLIGEGELPDRAEGLVAAWEAEAAHLGLSGDEGRIWTAGWEWITARRRQAHG
jgi:hypothetical protein